IQMRAGLPVLLGIAIGAAAAGPTHAQATFTGTWKTHGDKPGFFNDVTLTQNGANVTGDFTVATPGDQLGTTGHITGTVLNGNLLSFTFTQDYRVNGKIEPNTFQGTGLLTLCSDNNHFAGTYAYAPHRLVPPPWDQGLWIGNRKGPAADLVDKITAAY